MKTIVIVVLFVLCCHSFASPIDEGVKQHQHRHHFHHKGNGFEKNFTIIIIGIVASLGLLVLFLSIFACYILIKLRREREIRVQLEIQRLANTNRRPHKRQNDPKSPPDSKNNSITPPAAPDGHDIA